jgi:two-component system chemotaxis response regulator CheB
LIWIMAGVRLGDTIASIRIDRGGGMLRARVVPSDPAQGEMTPCVVIGASGSQGLRDLRALLEALPRSLNAIVLVVLHRPADRPSALATVLACNSSLPVRVARHGQSLSPGTIYVGEPDQHLTLTDHHALLVPHEPSVHRNRTIDLLFKSVAAQAGPRAIGIVLSGSQDDGSRGLETIHKHGGVTMVLTPESDRPPGMPENAINFDSPINVIGSVPFIAAAISHLVANPNARNGEFFEREL